MGGGKDRDFIYQQHIQISSLIKRQSEHDFQRGSMKMGLLMEQNVSLLNKREKLSDYCVLHTQLTEVVL